jgi:hypothetical protein
MTETFGNLVRDVWHIAAIGLGFLLSVLATGHKPHNPNVRRKCSPMIGFSRPAKHYVVIRGFPKPKARGRCWREA